MTDCLSTSCVCSVLGMWECCEGPVCQSLLYSYAWHSTLFLQCLVPFNNEAPYITHYSYIIIFITGEFLCCLDSQFLFIFCFYIFFYSFLFYFPFISPMDMKYFYEVLAHQCFSSLVMWSTHMYIHFIDVMKDFSIVHLAGRLLTVIEKPHLNQDQFFHPSWSSIMAPCTLPIPCMVGYPCWFLRNFHILFSFIHILQCLSSLNLLPGVAVLSGNVMYCMPQLL